jgi:hypothetical protein
MTIKTINGKQVNLLIALLLKAGIAGETKQLEFIEYDCGIEIKKFEQLNYGQLQLIIAKLKSKYNIEVY